MKKSLVVIPLIIFLCLTALPTFGATGPYWIAGNLAPTIDQQTYGTTAYYAFNFTIRASSSGFPIANATGKIILVLWAKNLTTSAPVQNGNYNFTGMLTSAGEIAPVISFVVSKSNISPPSLIESAALYVVVGVAIAALIYAVLLARQVFRESTGSGKVKDVWEGIRSGANAYLRTQLRSIIIFVLILGVFLYVSVALSPPALYITSPLLVAFGRVGAFLMGASFSAMVGYIGMNMAVQGNIRVSEASRTGFRKALRIAYRTGTITGMLTDGLGLLGGTIIFLIFLRDAPEVLLGFGFGGTLLALFMRVGGGIYTKAADVGADLVGKVEKGIPEDDPRNAAVVADLVGDNVGDCAGMAADIFESYEVTMVSALLLGLLISPFDYKWIVFPLLARGIGVVSTIVGTYAVSLWPDSLTKGDAFKAMDLSYDVSSVISSSSFLVLSLVYVHDIRVFIATTMGIILAISFNKLANYFTSPNRNPTDQVAKASRTGAATLLLQGLALGFESSVWTVLVIAVTIVVSTVVFTGGGLILAMYGVALAGIGMLTHTGNNVAMDSFGPIVDNANGIGEMAGQEKESRQILADLDASGNTTKAVTKAIAISSAVLAAVSLFATFTQYIPGLELDIAKDPLVFVGLLVGASLPFLFSFISIRAVGRAAGRIIEEVREQFRIPGIMEGKKLPDYAAVVRICTSAAQRELASLAVIAILTPLLVGMLLGAPAWGGFLAGVILTGQLMAVFMANTGGSWDNAKKKIEDGYYGGKGSEEHKASVIGDTVGDPLKDTAGPALNPMIKVINLISLLFATVIISVRNQAVFHVQIGTQAFPISLLAVVLSIILVAIIAYAIAFSKRETKEITSDQPEKETQAEASE
jgi:K(+)-stimulated pyrophosphate-energized sodium pump